MNNKISTGIWLVFIGLVILLHNINMIQFNFYAIIKFWPLALISAGVSLFLQGKTNGTLISTLINVVICIFLLIVGTSSSDYSEPPHSTNSYRDNQERVSTIYNGTEMASIEINGGAAKYVIGIPPDSNQLFVAASTGAQMHLELNENNAKDKLELDMKIRGNDSHREPVALFFNDNPLWDITFNVGAVSVDGDFSNHRIRNFSINSGASSFKVKYGKPTDGISKININTAASSVKLSIPKDVPYAIKSDNIISNTRIDGRKQKNMSRDVYKTDNYDEVANKYYFEISGAANSFSLETY